VCVCVHVDFLFFLPEMVNKVEYIQGGLKKVIPLVKCNVMYERYHFFGPPCILHRCRASWLPAVRIPDHFVTSLGQPR